MLGRIHKDAGAAFCSILLTMAIMSVICLPLVSYANNHSDERFAKYVSSYNSVYYTPGRRKYDASSMYTYNDKSASAYYASGVGYTGGGYSANTVIDRTLC